MSTDPLLPADQLGTTSAGRTVERALQASCILCARVLNIQLHMQSRACVHGRRGWAPPMYLRCQLSPLLVTRPCADAWRWSMAIAMHADADAWRWSTLASQWPWHLHADGTCMPMALERRWHLHADGTCDRLTSLRPKRKARPARLPSGRAPSTCAPRTALLSNAPAKLGKARGQGPINGV